MATSVASSPASVECGGKMTTSVSTSSHHHQSSTSRKSAASTSSSAPDASVAPPTPSGSSVMQVPLVRDTMTFDGRQATRLRDLERRAETEIKRKKRELEREIEKMREEFIRLYPTDRQLTGLEMQQYNQDPLIIQRSGSTDILDEKKIRTSLIVDKNSGGPGFGTGHHPESSVPCRLYRPNHNYFMPTSGACFAYAEAYICRDDHERMRFDLSGCDPSSVRVSTDGDRIVVRANKPVTACPEGEEKAVGEHEEEVVLYREYSRKIQKPKDVDHTKFKSYLTVDSVLVVEAPLTPINRGVKKTVHSPSRSSHSISPSGSPATGGADTPSKDKIGVPVFRDENGQRRLHLIVDVGSTFKPEDIIVQVIKDNKIQVRAKHEEKTFERLSKSKFIKEYELGERIETYSLTGGLAADGRLIVGAFVKGHGEGSFSKPGGASANNTTVAASAINGSSEGDDAVGQSQQQAPPTVDKSSLADPDCETGNEKSSALEPCKVRSAATSGVR